MSIRTKCALLVIGFEVVLCATLWLTVRYIGGYFRDVSDTFGTSSVVLADIQRLRILTRNQFAGLLQSPRNPLAIEEHERLLREIDAAATAVRADLAGDADAALAADLARHLDALRSAAVDHVAELKESPDAAAKSFNPAPHLEMGNLLGRIESLMFERTRGAVDAGYRAQRTAIMLLGANAVIGVVLGIGGLFLVRRWVLQPIEELKRTTDEFGKGNLTHVARVGSGDEFGRLAGAVNRMASDLSKIERRMVERERMAAMGEMISYVAHNIRNPLAGIQAAAEASQRQLPPDSPVRAHQDVIVSALEQFQSWLRQVERICAPMKLQTAPTDVRRLIEHVATAFRPMSQRRSIHVDAQVEPDLGLVAVDARYFEQALAAVLGNAIEASPDSGRVHIRAARDGEPSQWTLSVADEGPGIPADIIHQVFEPTFSTKKTGHGLGLALVRRIVGLHGGQVSATCPARGGTVIAMSLPR